MDAELKTICEQFISETTSSFIAPLNSLLDKIDTILKMAEEEGKDGKQLLKQQPFAKSGEFLFFIVFISQLNFFVTR